MCEAVRSSLEGRHRVTYWHWVPAGFMVLVALFWLHRIVSDYLSGAVSWLLVALGACIYVLAYFLTTPQTEITSAGVRVKERWRWRHIPWSGVQAVHEASQGRWRREVEILAPEGFWITLPGVAEDRAQEVQAYWERHR